MSIWQQGNAFDKSVNKAIQTLPSSKAFLYVTRMPLGLSPDN